MARQDPNAAGDPEAIVPEDPDSSAFVRNLVASGRAAHANADGSLPPGATHEIVGATEAGLPVLVRRRFSAGPFGSGGSKRTD